MPAPVRITIWSASRSQPATSSTSNSVSMRTKVRDGAGVADREPSPGRPHPTRAGSGGGGWEQTGFPRGFAVAVPGPTRRVVADGGGGGTGEQCVLDVVVTVALLEQRQREPACATTRRRHRRLVEARVGPLGVIDLEMRRQSADMALLYWREAAPHRHRAAAVAARELELLEPAEGAHDRRAAAALLAEAERLRGDRDLELDGAGVAFEARDEVAQQQQGGGAERVTSTYAATA